MIPRGKLILLFAVAGVPLLASVWIPEAREIGLFINGMIVAAAVIDLLITPSPRHLDIEREVPAVLSIGTKNAVTLRAVNRSRVPLEVQMNDSPPHPSTAFGLPLRVKLPPWKERAAVYRLRPEERGRKQFRELYLRYASRLGLWTFVQTRTLTSPVRIYPDIQAVHRFDLLARKNRLQEVGLKVWRLRGRGGEFERLREYRREDEPRHIDWKATSKYNKLVSREFTVERNQNILVLLDCGRSMCNETGGISHLDRGINASLMLSYIALGQGDNVALLAFSNQIERAVGPVRGKPAIQAIIRQVFDLEARYDASDYARAYDELRRRQRKRALILLITHALDEQHLRTIGTYLRTLTSTHLTLCVFLRDVHLAELANRTPQNDLESFHVAAAAELLSTQARKIAELRDAGVMVLETLPQNLSAEVINQYLMVKAQQLL